MTDESHGGNLAVPGPADREHFFAAQGRNRRATWRLTALAVLGVLLMGIPMSVVISPLVYAALFVLNDVVNLVVPTPNLLYLAAHLDQNPAWTGLPELTRNALVFGALVVPGSLVMLVAWLGARALFLTAGPESMLRALGAREPRSGDLEEQQLRNLVAEMAIAGGVKPPRVLLLDGTAANAAAVGSSPDDATIVVSRRLLDELDREETQAIIGHLVGAVGNGDLGTALVVLSMYRAFGLVMTALGAAFGRASRRTLLHVVGVAFRRTGTGATAAELHDLDEMLAKSVEMSDGDLDSPPASKKTTIADILRLPFLMAYTAFWMARIAFVSFVVGPLIALLWRARRHLADATAVQLTRNPDGLARALASLAAKGGVVPGGSWAAPLFVIGPEGGSGTAALKGDDFGLVRFSPPVSARLVRLRRQGATVSLPIIKGTHPAAVGCMALIAVPIGAVLIGCALALAGIALAIDMLFLTPVFAIAHIILRRFLGG